MRHVALSLLAASAIIILAIAPISAQHGVAAKFDLTKPLTLKGTVTQIDWANPYAHVIFKVAGPNNTQVRWAAEVESPILLTQNGWSKTTVQPGDTVTVQGFAARDGSHQISGKSLVLGSGKSVLVGYNGTAPAKKAAAAAPTPRWPDGKPRLGPTPGTTGYWGNPSKTALVEDSAKVDMDAYGLLKNVADASKVAPFQKWALDLYTLRQKNFLKDDPMYLLCKPPGGPRQFESIYGFQLMEDRDHNRIFVLMGGGNRNERIMYTDARQQVGQLRGDADNPLYYGRAVAHWEGDTLVEDIKGFNEKFWMDNGGLPHTDKLHLIERFTRTDMNTLKYEVTIDDVGAYTRTWKASWQFEWIPGQETPYYLCQDNRP